MTDLPTVTLACGARMPLLGFGTWQLRGSACYDAVRTALDAGYRHIDTATMYGNEDEVGRALHDSGLRREEVFLTTKLPAERAGRERQTLMASLKALGVDAIDLWLVHWPPRGRASTAVWREFIAARDDGLATSIGVSNYSTDLLDDLIADSGETPAVNQIPWSPWDYSAEIVADHRDRGVVIEGYSPFKRSDLLSPVLAAIAQAHGVTPAQVVLRWHIEHGIVAIPKSTTPERIRANLDLTGFSLTSDELARIDALS